MHPSIALITIVSVILIIAMVACFICFVRSRQREEEELVKRIQQQQQQIVAATNRTPQHLARKMSLNPSNNNNLPSGDGQPMDDYQQQQQQQTDDRLMSDYQNQVARNSFILSSSPYNASQVQMMQSASPNRGEIRQQTDMSQQINSAIIGSSEAEFQNDFIQVFPMYQIAPMPEKNTTPYLN